MQSTVAPSLAFAPLALSLAACVGTEASPTDLGSLDAEALQDAEAAADVGSATDVGSTADMGSGMDLEDAGAACTYPAGATEPMALDEVLSPYRWPVALEVGSGRQIELDLAKIHCNDDPEIDWSMVNSLLFVSVPAF